MTPVRPAAAIAWWSIGAIGIAAIALAGDRTVFRVEPTTPARVAAIGLVGWLVIGWPIWSFGRLTRAFVIGQGAVVLLIASATAGEAVTVTLEWLAACGIAFGAAAITRRVGARRAIAWTLLTGIAGGLTTIWLLRGMAR